MKEILCSELAAERVDWTVVNRGSDLTLFSFINIGKRGKSSTPSIRHLIFQEMLIYCWLSVYPVLIT